MKIQKLPAVVALATIGYSAQAFAQSSVTLYGLIDAGINFTSNVQTARPASGPQGNHQYSFQDGATGGIRGSRWGIRGVEDLGGGLKAVFVLENGFSIGNGALAQGGAEFGRQAFVGLQSSYGTLTLGRQYDSVVDYTQLFQSGAQWAGYMGAHAGDVDNALNTRRINNAVKFASNDYSGLRFGGLYSFGGVPGSVSRNQVWSLGGGYTHGPFGLGMAYLNARNPNLGFYGSNPNNGTTAASNNLGSLGSATTPESNPIYAGYASASTLQIISAAGSYQIGSATLGLTYSNVQFRGLGSTSGPNPLGYTGNARFNNVEVNGRYQLTPAWLAGVAYIYTNASGAENRSGALYHQLQAGSDYFLSKRTDVYFIVVYQHASGTDSLGQPAVAYLTGQTPSASNHQLALRIGITHRF
ncbi:MULTISPECIES: porin [Burkholderiaceae]|uniref:porin n=1 Tax=Burkholderiaceae TaxID=119060 RepID=UPI001420193A|nr:MULTISPECIES: porin [Burkholderiaceae]MBN3846606.1 porin [Paraburkholderia sp. Ac-20342]NIF55691.1 porin [Burkholderia sp. Ax-1724]NIF78014.1 porin [Paraburkholderia sp. Cy-641]